MHLLLPRQVDGHNIQLMPFAQIQYRYLMNAGLGYQAARSRFLCITITYTAVFLCLSFVFLGLFIHERNSLDAYNCSICASEGTPYQCGYQQCCDQPGGFGSFYFNSYMYCLGNYTQLIWFIIMIVLFAYVAYEIFLILCTLCTSPIFWPGQGMMMGGPTVGMVGAYGSPYGYGNTVVVT